MPPEINEGLKAKRKPRIQKQLVYEVDGGKPIYYRGYKAVVNKTKTLEDIMGCSVIQSLLATLISYFVKDHFPQQYVCLSNELGLKIAPKTRRNLDLAVYDKTKLADRAMLFSDQYALTPPEMVFEIDTKADLRAFDTPADYYHRKTEQLLQFGVGKVVWVFTGSRKYLFAEPGKQWIIGNWSDDLELLPGVVLNLERLVNEV